MAFNGGSELAIVGGDGGHGQAVALSFMNTVIGGAAGAMFSIVLNYSAAIVRRKYSSEYHYFKKNNKIFGGKIEILTTFS